MKKIILGIISLMIISAGSVLAQELSGDIREEHKGFVESLRKERDSLHQQLDLNRNRIDALQDENQVYIERLEKIDYHLDRLEEKMDEGVYNAENWNDERVQIRSVLDEGLEIKPFALSPIEQEWTTAKNQYKEKFKAAIDDVSNKISMLQKETDAGDPKRRDQIAEQINDLQRTKGRLGQRYNELQAATAIDFMNIRNRFNEVVEDARD